MVACQAVVGVVLPAHRRARNHQAAQVVQVGEVLTVTGVTAS